MQKLQADTALSWDKVISDDMQNEWLLICKQANAACAVEIPRSIGSRKSIYNLTAFSDASSQCMGVVIYIKNLETGNVSYLASKYKLVQISSTRKMPALELLAILIGTEFLQEMYEALTGESIVRKIKIARMDLYTDSLVCLHWLDRYTSKFDKMQNISVFVQNKLRSIDTACRHFPIE